MGKVDYLEIFSLAQIKCWSWCKAYKPKTHFSYAEWCISLIDCLKLWESKFGMTKCVDSVIECWWT